MAAPLRDPPALHDRAIQDLSFIRRTMEGAASFTDVPGWGLVATGVTAIGAAALASFQPSAGRWLFTWLAEAVLATSLGGVMMWRKMRRRGSASEGGRTMSVPARKFVLGLAPAIVAGAVLTIALVDSRGLWDPASLSSAGANGTAVLPGLWLLLYGVGVVTAGAFSVRAVPMMGLLFMGLGALTLIVRALPGDIMLAVGFGMVQIGFGTWIVRRYGG